MESRLELHEELKGILGTDKVYFQPPESIKLSYPCIVYERSDISSKRANNKHYYSVNCYTLTVIDKNPDSQFANQILEHFKMCRFNRRFVTDNLYHDVLILYF